MSPSSSQSPPATREPPDKLSSPFTSPRPAAASLQTISESQPRPEPSTSQAPFTPFFTLISDTSTGIIHHPKNVHYIFSDDDPDILTNACLDTLHNSNTANSPAASSHTHEPSSGSTPKAVGIRSSLKPGIARSAPERRILLLDLDTSGTAIKSAHSLSSSWQIVSTALSSAPTWGAESSPTTHEADPASLMLKIEGTDGSDVAKAAGIQKASGGDPMGTLGALMEEFERKMKVLRTVVGEVEKLDDHVEDQKVEKPVKGETHEDLEGE